MQSPSAWVDERKAVNPEICSPAGFHQPRFPTCFKGNTCIHCGVNITPLVCRMCNGSGRIKVRTAGNSEMPWRVSYCEPCMGSGALKWLAVEKRKVKP